MSTVTIFYLLSGFIDFFGSSVSSNSCVTQRAVNPSTGSYFCLDCSFSSMRISGSGSVFYFSTTSSVKLLVELSSFLNCSSTDHGGAIFFNCINGGFVSHKVCAGLCYTNNPSNIARGQLFFSTVNTTMINGVFMNSVVKCSESVRNLQWYSIALFEGNIRFKNTNSSQNSVEHVGMFGSNYAVSLQSEFNTFEHIYSPSGAHLANLADIQEFIVEASNFINNTNESGIRGIIDAFSNGRIFLQRCVFARNLGLLFCSTNKYSLTAKNCYIFHQNAVLEINATLVGCVFRDDIDRYHFMYHSTKHCQTDLLIPILAPRVSCFIEPQNIKKYIITMFSESLIVQF